MENAFHNILILLASSILVVALFRYLKLPQILGYLCVGMLVGPYGFGWIVDAASTRHLAEFGLVFLMFTIGMEFSWTKLVSMRRLVFGLGALQVLVCGAVFGLIVWFYGLSAQASIVIGGVLAMSSTAIVTRALTEQLEIDAKHGRRAFSVLLFQDLIVVPFLILISVMGANNEQSIMLAMGTALFKGTIVLTVIILLGHVLLRPVLHAVALARSRELFVLTVLLVTLFAAFATDYFGLPLTLGAFIAGMMLGETEYRHQVESDILPFRDILLGLFFITVGMMLNIKSIQALWPWILVCVAGLILLKALMITGMARLFSDNMGTALRTGLVLAQGGEFGFALLVHADTYGILSAGAGQILLSSVLISMLIAPIILRENSRIARLLLPSYAAIQMQNLEQMSREAGGKYGHVIICGYGRCGQNLAWMLEQEHVASVALDLDPVRVIDARNAGRSVYYGDATRPKVMEAMGLKNASAVSVSFADVVSARRIIETVREINEDVPVIVRTIDDLQLEALKRAGATSVVPESLEGSLMIGTKILRLLGVPDENIDRQVNLVREKRYRMLRDFFHGGEWDETEQSQAFNKRLHSVCLQEGAYAVDKILADLNLHQHGVKVTGLRRNQQAPARPDPQTIMHADDILILYGRPEALEKAERFLLKG